MLAVLALGMTGACRDASEPGSGSVSVVSPPAGAVLANEGVLAELPALPGARFVAYNETESPKGGTGAMSYVYFATPGTDRAAAIAHFKAVLAGWTLAKEETHATRSTVTYTRGDAWVSVTSGQVSGSGGEPVDGYVLVVNARDAGVLRAG